MPDGNVSVNGNGRNQAVGCRPDRVPFTSSLSINSSGLQKAIDGYRIAEPRKGQQRLSESMKRWPVGKTLQDFLDNRTTGDEVRYLRLHFGDPYPIDQKLNPDRRVHQDHRRAFLRCAGRRARSPRISPRSPFHKPLPKNSTILRILCCRTVSAKALFTVSEYVFVPSARRASSRVSPSNTRFVRFMCIVYLGDPAC